MTRHSKNKDLWSNCHVKIEKWKVKKIKEMGYQITRLVNTLVDDFLVNESRVVIPDYKSITDVRKAINERQLRLSLVLEEVYIQAKKLDDEGWNDKFIQIRVIFDDMVNKYPEFKKELNLAYIQRLWRKSPIIKKEEVRNGNDIV